MTIEPITIDTSDDMSFVDTLYTINVVSMDTPDPRIEMFCTDTIDDISFNTVINESMVNESMVNKSMVNESLVNESLVNESLVNRSAIDDKQKLIFVFDFDLTLTDRHTRGSPSKYIQYISDDQLKIIMEHMDMIKRDNQVNECIILTRTPEVTIKNYLEENKKYDDLTNSFKTIIGPTYDEYYRDSSEKIWALWKVSKLNNLQEENPTCKIFFFDDTKINCDEAIKAGYTSFHVKSPSMIGILIKDALKYLY